MNIMILSRKDNSVEAIRKSSKLSYQYKYYVFAETVQNDGKRYMSVCRGSNSITNIYEAGSRLIQHKFKINDKLLKYYDLVYTGECPDNIQYYDARLKSILVKVFPEEFI